MREIRLGTKGTFTMRVEPGHLANQFKDAILPRVLATPMMILMMENAALERDPAVCSRTGRERSRCPPSTSDTWPPRLSATLSAPRPK